MILFSGGKFVFSHRIYLLFTLVHSLVLFERHLPHFSCGSFVFLSLFFFAPQPSLGGTHHDFSFHYIFILYAWIFDSYFPFRCPALVSLFHRPTDAYFLLAILFFIFLSRVIFNMDEILSSSSFFLHFHT